MLCLGRLSGILRTSKGLWRYPVKLFFLFNVVTDMEREVFHMYVSSNYNLEVVHRSDQIKTEQRRKCKDVKVSFLIV